ncbi:hypothetical protein [Ferruginibacter sp. SUN106]|uniref:hypothetical protein n=1 Tax=Ferruginibacter sp. SUN106 TaxID=2978348 RepID=UPI003D365BA8
MKSLLYIFIAAGIITFTACEKKDVAAGLPELEHHYYAIFVPNNNTGVTVTRNQATLLKFPVQFYSTFTRSYDAVAKYAVTTAGITTPAVRGTDYNIVDKNGAVIQSADTTYSIIFPQAKQAMDTIYIKLLNNTAPGVRKFEVQMLDNITGQFDVDIFSTAFRRPVQIN